MIGSIRIFVKKLGEAYMCERENNSMREKRNCSVPLIVPPPPPPSISQQTSREKRKSLESFFKIYTSFARGEMSGKKQNEYGILRIFFPFPYSED